MGTRIHPQHCSNFSNRDYHISRRTTTLVPNKQFHFKRCGEIENVKMNPDGDRKGTAFVRRRRYSSPAYESLAQNLDSPAMASQLSALALFPYVGFLYFIAESKSAPRLTLFGFYFLLAFVGAAVLPGIYAKVHYLTSLSNVDWLHGGAESLLMVTNLFIVMGLRRALRKAEDESESPLGSASEVKEEE